jgi:hypothetical protein
MTFRRLAFLSLLALPALPAPVVAQDISLASVTCAEAMAEGAPIPWRHLAAALVGHLAARAGASQVRIDVVPPIRTALRAACEAPDGAARRLVDIAAAVAPPEGEAAMIDFATLTCAELAPRWRRDAQVIVPALVALVAGPEGRIARTALDRVGEGLPRICRDPAEAGRRVTEAAAAIP